MSLKTRLSLFVVLVCFAFEFASAQSTTPTPTATNAAPVMISTNGAGDLIVLPNGFNDPIEPFNRDVWAFNTGFMSYVVRPFSKGYRWVVIKPVRTGIGKMGKNLTYPDRLVNNLLQGNWKGACDETSRCICNTLFGLGGFFDVATRLHIPKSDEDFGRTFKKWGWQPGFYLMLPIFGPSDDRDAVGLGGDTLANPMTYFFPYDLISSGVTANNFSDSVEGAVRFSKAEADSYSILEEAWSFGHENREADLRVIGSKDAATLETLQSFFYTYGDPEFPAKATTRSVLIPATGKKLDFTYWLQPKQAPVVYIVPGLGAHRLAGNVLALAELLYDHGFSAVCVSSTFHPEFMEEASTSDLPAYPPADIRDLHVALTEVDHRLSALYPHRLGARALMGYSMGAFQCLFLAANAATNQAPLVKFDRYVAIDVPVRLRYGVTNLDQFYQAPMAWPAEERTANIENTLLKVVALTENPPTTASASGLPFSAIESRFLIGLSFRLSLRDIIFSSQLRHNQGVLKQPLKKSRRRAAYDEIMQYSFHDYITKFAAPYDLTKGIDMADPEVGKNATDLRCYSDELRTNENIRVIANRNDFLLADEDIAWLKATFAPGHLTLFDQGGHLGNLSQPAVQETILKGLQGLGAEMPVASAAGAGAHAKPKNE